MFKIFLFLFVTEFLVTTIGINFFIHNCNVDQKHLIILDDNDRYEHPHDSDSGCCSSKKYLSAEIYSDLPELNCCTDSHNYLKIFSYYINSENVYNLNLLKNTSVVFNYIYTQELISILHVNYFSNTCYITKTGIKIILGICKLTI